MEKKHILNSLSGRLLLLTIVLVMLAEIFIFVPSVARYRQDYLLDRLERAQIASLALLVDDMLTVELEKELLDNAEVFNVVLRRDEVRQLILSSEVPEPINTTFDLRDIGVIGLIRDAMIRLMKPENEMIRVIGSPVREAGQLIEVTIETAPLRNAMIDYGLRILLLSAIISMFTAILLFIAVRYFLVKPIKGVIGSMQRYASSPEDMRRIIKPSAGVVELREAEEALKKLQTELTASLKQKERLAQLGKGVAKVSHDLRNILTSAQLFADRIEFTQDPLVSRLVPKIVHSIRRAVSLCESTLAFGRAEEPAPALAVVSLTEIVSDVFESERLADGSTLISFVEDIPFMMKVRVDQEQFYRVIMNLVRNARQAIVTTGQAGEIKVSAREDHECWRIEVKDTGPGLPDKARKHLFTPFYGGVRKGGFGLGLTIAEELIRGHGGSLTLKTTEKTGTVFEICLPKGESTA